MFKTVSCQEGCSIFSQDGVELASGSLRHLDCAVVVVLKEGVKGWPEFA